MAGCVRALLYDILLSLTCPPTALFLLDDMPKLRGKVVHAPTDPRAEPHRLVCETKAESASASQAIEWGAPESPSPVGLSYRPSCVSHPVLALPFT